MKYLDSYGGMIHTDPDTAGLPMLLPSCGHYLGKQIFLLHIINYYIEFNVYMRNLMKVCIKIQW